MRGGLSDGHLSFRVYREERAAWISEAQKCFPFGSLAHT